MLGNNATSKKLKPTIVYFIAGTLPTDAEKADAAKYGKVRFRNVTKVKEDDAVEPCDYVAGIAVPKYHTIPHASEMLTPEAPSPGINETTDDATDTQPKTVRRSGARRPKGAAW